jgi:methylphosphotriester-DNA--protein-cysteine methyltransferase
MKTLMAAIAGLFILSFTGLAHADFVGNKSSKLFFPDTCSYVKMIKKDNAVPFKTSAEAVAAGYKASSKCQDDSSKMSFVGNKTSKMFFPADCSYVKMIKDGNKVTFKSSQEAITAGYKASSKCTDSK